MFVYLIATLAILFIYILVMKRQKTWIKRDVKQISTTPVFGDTLEMFFKTDSLVGMIRKLYNSYPNERYIGAHIMTSPILMLRDADLIKELTLKNFNYFTDHVSFIDNDPLWRKNVFTLRGDEWRHMRAILAPTFTGSKLQTMFSLINDCAKKTTAYYLNKNEQKIELELKDTFSRYTNDVIATCLFEVTIDSMKEPNNEFYIKGKEVTTYSNFIRNCKTILGSASPMIAKFLDTRMYEDDVVNYFQKIITDGIYRRESQHIVRQDMINLLMEARKSTTPEKTAENVSKAMKLHSHEITDVDITAQLLLCFIAAFITISSVTSFFAHELVSNPEIQDRLIQEVDANFEACKGEITYNSLIKMKYMDMIYKEVLRKWPPTNVTHRMCTKPYTIQPTNPSEKPVPIKVGELVWLPIIGLHYDPKYFENPNTFDPERFNDDNKHKINPYAYMPFGAGPRMCIAPKFAALQIKTMIFNILSKFRFVATEKTEIPVKLDIKTLHLTSDGGFWMAIEKR